MKKVALLMQAKDADSAVSSLRKLGVVHVKHQQPPKGADINSLHDELALLAQASGILSSAEYSKDPRAKTDQDLGDWKFACQHIIDAQKRLERLDEYSRMMNNMISRWQAWGDFNPQDLQEMAGKGVYIRLYSLPAKEINNLPKDVIVKKISAVRGIINCAVVSRKMVEIPFKEVIPPKISLKDMRARLAEDTQTMKAIKEEISRFSSFHKEFLHIGDSLRSRLEFHQALRGMGLTGEIAYLTGFVPHDMVESLQEAARQQRWGIVVDDPADDERVPTLIRNPRWVSIISPIFKMIEVVPGYHEFDISLWVLVFLSIFFGMLIGDAAYGAIFFALTLLAQLKWGSKLSDKSVFILFYLFSLCAVAWGVLTGTFFGQEWLPQTVQPLLPALRNSRNIQVLCFFLGAAHLSIAHLWRLIVKAPSLTALSEAGWISVLWGAFFLAKTLIIGDNFPAFGKWFFIVGPVLVVFFTSFRKNIFKGIGAGLGSLLLNFVNTFTDVVSYIRLFAVGLATVAIADSFNKLALSIGFNSVISGAATALILLLGHSLNILLGPMGVLVHGVRLNVLEFCNHIDVKWSGFRYNPLREAA
ncbi:V-type ATP synthase subunit I [Candidatus Omnitrophota bacterium]